jgi:hypothetical protein
MLRRRVLPFALFALAFVPATSAHAAVSVKKALWGPVEFEATSQFPTYKELGAGIYMTKLEWDKVAVLEPDDARDPLDASYDWPLELDTAIDEAKQNGIDVALTVTGTPGWANGDKAPRFAPTDNKDYADFLTAAAKRYPAVHLWVIWDGPTQSENFQPVSATRYARLLDGAYGALKAASKLNRVVGGNSFTVGKVAPQRWIRSLKLPNGKRPRMDFYGHDAFSTRRPNLDAVTLGKGTADLSDIDTLHEWVDDAFGTKRLFITNFTLPTNDNWRYDFKVSAATQASWLTAALRIAKREKYIYSLAYNGLFDEESRGDDKQVESGLIALDGTKRTAFNAYKRG